MDPELGDELLGWELMVLLLELDCSWVKPEEESDFKTPDAFELLTEADKPLVPLAPPLPVEEAAAVDVDTAVIDAVLLLFLKLLFDRPGCIPEAGALFKEFKLLFTVIELLPLVAGVNPCPLPGPVAVINEEIDEAFCNWLDVKFVRALEDFDVNVCPCVVNKFDAREFCCMVLDDDVGVVTVETAVPIPAAACATAAEAVLERGGTLAEVGT